MTVHLSIDARVDINAHSGRDGSAATSSSSSSSSSLSSSSSSPPKSPPSLPPIDILFVWDFDWTIVDCNSDEYVPAQFLGTEEMERRLRRYVNSRGPTRWHECVSDVVNECVEECHLSDPPGDVRAAAARMPYLADVRGAIEDVGGRGKGVEASSSSSSSFSSSCYGQAIISDGNDCFIKAFLNENGMGGHFTHGIETNMGRWEESRGGGGTTEVDDASSSTGGGTGGGGGGNRLLFRVVHQSSKYGGHANITCPPNLCKTQVLLDILSRITTTTTAKTSRGGGGRRPRVVYVGDGSNDACPALRVLDERDVLLARTGRRTREPNSRSGGRPDDDDDDDDYDDGDGDAPDATGDDDEFGILPAIESRTTKRGGASAPRCRVRAWNTGRQLRSLVGDILNEESTRRGEDKSLGGGSLVEMK